MKKWFKYVKPYLVYFICGPLCMIIEVIGEVLMPLCFARVMNLGSAFQGIEGEIAKAQSVIGASGEYNPETLATFVKHLGSDALSLAMSGFESAFESGDTAGAQTVAHVRHVLAEDHLQTQLFGKGRCKAQIAGAATMVCVHFV